MFQTSSGTSLNSRRDEPDLVQLLAMRTRRMALVTALGLAICLALIALANTRAQSRQNTDLIRLSVAAAYQQLQSAPTEASGQQQSIIAQAVAQEAERRTLAGELSENLQMALVAFAAFATFVGAQLWLQRRWVAQALSPLQQMLSDMRAFEDGDLARRTGAMELPELNALAKGFNHLADSLQASIEAQQTLSRQSLDLRRLERTRVARDLHDDLGQILTAAAIEIETARARGAPAQALEGVATSVDLARQRLRTLLASLRDELALQPATRWQSLLAPWQEHHPEVNWEIQDGLALFYDGLPQHQASVLQRIVQEALVNAFRHARPQALTFAFGQARSASLTQGSLAHLTITNDGLGAQNRTSPSGHGFGIAGMGERLALIGGQLTIDQPAPGQWQVRCEWPLDWPLP